MRVVARAEEDRDHLRALGALPLERPAQLHVEEVVGGEKIRAHEEQDHVGLFEVLVDGPAPLFAGADHPRAPAAHDTLAFQQREVLFQLASQLFVLGGVADENVGRNQRGHGLLERVQTMIVTKSLRGEGPSRPPRQH